MPELLKNLNKNLHSHVKFIKLKETEFEKKKMKEKYHTLTLSNYSYLSLQDLLEGKQQDELMFDIYKSESNVRL